MLTPHERSTDFPWLEGRVYLNSAAEGIPPRQVIAALAAYAEDKKLGMDGRPRHEQQRLACLDETARAYGLTPDEIAICSCSSEAYNLLALALDLRDGDEVVINDLDFPAGATPWLQPTCRATPRLWRAREGALRVEDLSELLGPKTRLVTVSLVSFYNGFRVPLASIVETVRRRSSALLAVDVTQALGRIPLDLRGADFIVSSTHKWILSAHGGGLIGVPAARAGDLTARGGGWFHLANAFDADRFERAVTRPGAPSFAVGMPNYSAIYAARAGLEYVRERNVTAIDNYARPLMQQCLDGLRQLPVELLTPGEASDLAGIVAFRHERAAEIHQRLHAENVHVMCSAGRVRVAIHFYNTPHDIERLLRVVSDTLGAGR